MVEHRLAKAALSAVFVVSVAACTAQDRYDSVRRENLLECDRMLTEVERERCRQQLAPATYEEYQRLRATVPVGAPPRPRERKGTANGDGRT